MSTERSRNLLAFGALIISAIMMFVTIGSLLFANRVDFMSKEDTLKKFEELEQSHAQAINDMAARLARLEQMHGPGGHQ